MRFIVHVVSVGVSCLMLLALIIGINTDRAVQRALEQKSIRKASLWAEHMANQIPQIEVLVATGRATEAQITAIENIRNLGDVFRFKIFDSAGRLVLISDDEFMAERPGAVPISDPNSVRVAATGEPESGIFQGFGNPERPDLYAEAYVPLSNADGSTLGVVKVYVDSTATRTFFAASFKSFGIIVLGSVSLILLIPASAYLFQRRLTLWSRQDVEYLARYDPLTGLMNRREFVENASALLADANLTVVCYIDVDHFKRINDTKGHAAGDAYLAHVADTLRAHARNDDLLARFGGDEFVIGFLNISLPAASKRVRALIDACAEDFQHRSTIINGTISVGMAAVDPDVTLEATLNQADAALYHAKSAGRNDYAVYGAAMGEELQRRTALEARVRAATKTFDFDVHYQPLVDSRTHAVIGYEALLRLADDDGEQIPPDAFIPMAEEIGLIDEIGRWVLHTAMTQLMEAGCDKSLALNLSPSQFRSGQLVQTVQSALTKTGFPAQKLELEITESLLLEDSPLADAQIEALKQMGVCIAMDDFGTGFSSLSNLWRYGFDRLKIDQSFIAALEVNAARSREIIETVILLGQRLDIKITAEGVETKEQSELLSALGCDILQGYLFGKAAPLTKDNAQDQSAA